MIFSGCGVKPVKADGVLPPPDFRGGAGFGLQHWNQMLALCVASNKLCLCAGTGDPDA